MDPYLLQTLVLIACFLSGALAGVDLDSVVVRFPAWRRLGASAWAAYSRKADLGNGLFLYPFLAIGHALLMIIVATGLFVRGPAGAIPAALLATSLAIIGLLFTIRAAPIMFRLKRGGDDTQAVGTAFQAFARWSLFRAFAQILAFAATLWLLVRVRV